MNLCQIEPQKISLSQKKASVNPVRQIEEPWLEQKNIHSLLKHGVAAVLERRRFLEFWSINA